MSWGLERAITGSGALGDLGAHVFDLGRYLVGGEIAAVSAATRTFIPSGRAGGRRRRRVRGCRRVRKRRGRDRRGLTVLPWAAERPRLGGQTGRRARSPSSSSGSTSSGRCPGRDSGPLSHGFRTVLVSEPEHPLGALVVARPHARLGAQLHPGDSPPARRLREPLPGRAARRDLRGRVSGRRGVRRGAAERRKRRREQISYRD